MDGIQKNFGPKPWEFWVDVGGTFTDCLACSPEGLLSTFKILSNSGVKGHGTAANGSNFIVTLNDKYPKCFLNDQNLEIRPLDSQTDQKFFSRIAEFDPETGALKLSKAVALEKGQAISFDVRFKEPAPVIGVHALKGVPRGGKTGPIRLKLGTTRGTNALLERTGARTALIINQGFADLAKIAFQDRPHLFQLNIRKPTPLFSEVLEITGRQNHRGQILSELDEDALLQGLKGLRNRGIESLAVSLIHSYAHPGLEQKVEALARSTGFKHVSLSHRMSAAPGWIVRTDTTLVDAYLNPVLTDYIAEIQNHLPEAEIQLMASSGSLFPANRFSGKDSVLSGPAGGVVGAARVGMESGFERIIGFDMGGTSTDVCRYSGDFERRRSMELHDEQSGGAIRIAAPMLSVETVAAGGGSICWFDGQMPRVGPRSAGAFPGPACYGNGGPLSITDINVFLGRVVDDQFPFSLDRDAINRRLDELTLEIRTATGRDYSSVELAEGFARIANANMAAPIRQISVSKGYDVRDYGMVSFGGAGSQHACFVAEELGIRSVICSPYGGILSAFGIGVAEVRRFAEAPVGRQLNQDCHLDPLFEPLVKEALAQFETSDSVDARKLEIRRYLDLRHIGQESTIQVEYLREEDPGERFLEEHQKLYGFRFQDRPIEIFLARVEVILKQSGHKRQEGNSGPGSRMSARTSQAWFNGEPHSTTICEASTLVRGQAMEGPAILTEPIATIVVPPGWRAEKDGAGNMVLTRGDRDLASGEGSRDHTLADPIELELFNQRFASIAELMGETLKRTSLSTNVKERFDFSCALFDGEGGLVVNAPHIPVHLGAMSQTVRCLKEDVPRFSPGDIYVTNDPYRGGSHLPDVTVITPVFVGTETAEPDFFVASRAHHSEIGGITPGSMPPFSNSLAEEGVVIRAFRLSNGDQVFEKELEDILATAPYPSRSVNENLADIHAQAAANQSGVRALKAWIEEQGLGKTVTYMGHIQKAAETKMRNALGSLEKGVYRFEDRIDDGSPMKVSITIDPDAPEDRPMAHIDFTGTAPVLKSNQNANPAIVSSAVIYCLRCLIQDDIPLNSGVLAPVTIHIPEGCFLNPTPNPDPVLCPPVAGGNVETSQRVVDVLLGALKVSAASQGTMNNLLFGRPSSSDRRGFGYYETIGGGSGATSEGPGADALHTHMTNTRLTDPEILEQRYPVQLRECSIRKGSGGKGRHDGGNGMVKEIEFLEDLDLSLVTSRRTSQPYGLAGGGPGSSGVNRIRRKDSSAFEDLPHACQTKIQAGDILRIETPGGGAFGPHSPSLDKD